MKKISICVVEVWRLKVSRMRHWGKKNTTLNVTFTIWCRNDVFISACVVMERLADPGTQDVVRGWAQSVFKTCACSCRFWVLLLTLLCTTEPCASGLWSWAVAGGLLLRWALIWWASPLYLKAVLAALQTEIRDNIHVFVNHREEKMKEKKRKQLSSSFVKFEWKMHQVYSNIKRSQGQYWLATSSSDQRQCFTGQTSPTSCHSARCSSK